MSTEPAIIAAPAKGASRRNQNACDACRARKIKCIYDGPACRSCLSSQIHCLQHRPRKKRGPSNRYVTEQQRHQPQVVESPTGLQSTATPSAHILGPSIEQLAPLDTIYKILTDWFEFVHPLAPIVHRDTLLRELANPVESHDTEFIDLIISLCAATLATLRTRATAYITPGLNVERCYQLILSHQASGSQPMFTPTLAWCQIKYNMSTSLFAERGIEDPTPPLLATEALVGLGHLIHHGLENMSFMNRELVKRLYWLCFAGSCSRGLHHRPYLNLVTPNLNLNGGAMEPLGINDAELATVTIGEENWHGNIRSYIPGLKILVQLFTMWHESQQGDKESLAHWRKWMADVTSALDYVLPELRWRGGLSRPPRSNFGTDVQMVNLYISQIHIRSFMLDEMDRIARQMNDFATMAEVNSSRQNLIDDMLAIVYQVPEDTLEANGYSLVPKLRDIGLSLLNINSEKDFANLDRLLAKLERLDGTQTSRFDSTSPLDFLMTPSRGN